MKGRRWYLAVAWALVGSLAQAATPGERLTEAVLGACVGLQAQKTLREEAADAAAGRFVQGGTLWVAGSVPRFDSEWLGRAGGLMPLSGMAAPGDVGAADVLVYGCRVGAEEADAARLRAVRERQGLVIAVGPASAPKSLQEAASFYLPVGLPADTPLFAQASASASLAALWAFTGDLVGACTRQGRMPTLWQSVMVPGSRERNAKYRSQRFHDDVTVPPQAPGVLGERYLAGLCTALTGLRSQHGKIAAAGALVRRAVETRHTVFHANMGHFEPALLLGPDVTFALSVLPAKDPEADLKQHGVAGDALLAVWYTAMPTALLSAAREKQVATACILAGNPTEARDQALADVLLDPQWVIGDAVVEVPGYDVRILPPSGVLNSAVFFAVLADAQAGIAAAR